MADGGRVNFSVAERQSGSGTTSLVRGDFSSPNMSRLPYQLMITSCGCQLVGMFRRSLYPAGDGGSISAMTRQLRE